MFCPAVEGVVKKVLGTPSEPLAAFLRQSFELRFGERFEDVRVHRGRLAGESAVLFGAAAYTVGSHVVFAPGRYQPESEPGRRLIAHELVHVLQQRGWGIPHKLHLGGPPELESEAHRIAASVLAGKPAGRWSAAAIPGLIQMHDDGPCPGPPEWRTIDAGEEAIWLEANLAIEKAYEAKFGRSGVLFGSDYKRYRGEFKNEIGLNEKELPFARELLKELRGMQNQNQPDIVDFRRRAFYEIKTVTSAAINPAKVQDQLLSLYRKTQAIAAAHAGTRTESKGNWDPVNANWYPSHFLPFLTDPDMAVCTAATDYKKWTPGMVLYEVKDRVVKRRRRRSQEQVEQVFANDVDLIDSAGECDTLMPLIQPGAQAKGRLYYPGRPEEVIILPGKFYDDWSRLWGARQWDLLRVKAPQFLDKNTPMGYWHNVVGAVVMIAAGSIALFGVVAAATTLAAASEIGAIAIVGTGTAQVTTEAQAISLAAYRAMKVAAGVQKMAQAAGVLLVLGVAKKAGANPVAISGVDVGARIVSVADFRIDGGIPEANAAGDPEAPYLYDNDTLKSYFALRKNVNFDGKKHVIVAMVWPHQ